jgi:superfamily II DNA/RNA helicase
MSHIHDPGDASPEGATDPSREPTLSTPATETQESAAPTDSAESPAEPAVPEPAVAAVTAPEPEPEAPAATLPTSFDDFNLPQTLRDAIREVGWDKPTPVQSAAFAPITEGRDVLVQSQTGTGKTGAFCVPWLAARFEAGDAAQTGVQLIALTPTRELAKQVCEELVRLARFANVVPLPIYGGTAMQPQLAALRTGVHAVVGTPGRVLDHIRRKSLDLSRVRMVVLDEADEMLSMGFLEDIHAILEACPRERQTTLFSATVPTEIERIARRYMRTPLSLRLSGDEIAAAAIDHTYYSVTSSVKTRDLLDVIAVEEPATALVFCNTREEVNLVASVLQREGFAAEPLSSDLTQTARERVLGWMREGRLRFLVATDVASRGIDISHISHVINYSFPENAESYVHRTGRTGRAGRAGKAISLISAIELGNFYYLKLQYPTITFTESHLPPGDDLQQQRSELKLDQVSSLFPELVSPEWTLLARNLMKDPRGERVIAFLLSEAMANRTKRPSLIAQDGTEAEQEPGRGRWERTERSRGGGAGGRDRGRGGGGGWSREGGEGRRDARGRDERGRDDRPRAEPRAEFDRPRDAVAAAPAVGEGTSPTDGAPEARVDGDARRDRGDQGDRGARRRDREAFRERSRQELRTEPRTEDGASAQGQTAPSAEADAPDDQTTPIAAIEGGDADDAAVATEGAPEGEGRRRRRRRGRRDRAGEPRTAAGHTSAAADGEPLEAAGDDAIGTEAADGADDELATASPDAAMGESADPAAQTTALGQEPGRRRRRRRRRGRSGPAAGAPVAEGAQRPTAAVAATDEGDDDEDREGDDDDDDDEGAATAGADDPAGRRRRRRRRRGRRRPGTEPVAATHQVVVPPRPAGQDEIVVDIDESELQLVRDQFGEIDELDDFTLKARRRGVLDALAEEVELEDLTASDRVDATPPPAAATPESDGDAEGDDAGDDGDTEGDAEGEAGAEGSADDEARRKRRRRRRKKKKVEAEPAPPPLMVPPHKDFWEVWATHFNYRDFEDPASAEPEFEPEPEPAPARGRDRDRDRDRPSAEPRPQEAIAADDTWVNVRLSLGRSHAKKAADIRDLLADRTGLTGKSVRNLTVGDRDTEFQIGRRTWPRLARAFGGVTIDGVSVDVTLLTVDEPTAAADEFPGATEASTSEPTIDPAPEAGADPLTAP